LSALHFNDVTDYLFIDPDTYTFLVYPAGTSSKPLINFTVPIMDNTPYSFTIINFPTDLGAELFIDYTLWPISLGNGVVQVVHLSPDTGAVDITVASTISKSISFSFINYAFSQATDYQQVPAGTYNVNISVHGSLGRAVVLNTPNLVVNPNTINTYYLEGANKNLTLVASTQI